MSDIGFVKRGLYPGYSEHKVEAILSTITDKEIESLFNKYEVYELELLSEIFEELQDYSMRDRIIIEKVVETENGNKKQKVNIINYIIKERIKEAEENYCAPIAPTNFDYSDLQDKNRLLSNEELEFLDMALYTLVKYMQDSKEIEEEAFAHGYQITQIVNTDVLNSLEVYKESLENEIGKRIKKLSLTLGV